LQVFFGKRKLKEEDICEYANENDQIILEVAFTALPEKIELEEGVETSLKEEMLVDSDGYLRIRQKFDKSDLKKSKITLIVKDFDDDNFSNLTDLTERQLNLKCEESGNKVSRSGRSITNKSKRAFLRSKALETSIAFKNQEFTFLSKKSTWKCISSLLPEYELFVADTKLGVGETTFQSQFRPIINRAASNSSIAETRDIFTDMIKKTLQDEINKIFAKLKQYTSDFEELYVKPSFSWEKAVNFEIFGKDKKKKKKSLDQRGSGIRRLLMVAYFQYLTERNYKQSKNFIYAIEEPENYLHPGLQRDLAHSFSQLEKQGHQIIITSHSPVFAGSSPIENLVLITRDKGIAQALQHPFLDFFKIAEELGIEPADQITGYDACVFVEGKDDIFFLNTISRKLKEAETVSRVSKDFDDRKIGFIICGGENLKHWINLRAMSRLNRRFGVVIDSDRENADHSIPRRKLNWKRKCEDDGGVFFILKKREIENYIHKDAIERSGRELKDYNDFSDMKDLFGENVIKVIEDMSYDEILEMDRYEKDGNEYHELVEIIQTLLALPDS